MATLDALPSQDIIKGMKGKLDYYVWKGLPCVRTWPVITGHHSTPRERANQTAFRYFQKSLKSIHPRVKNLWRGNATLAHWRWHEVAYRWYRGGKPGSLYGLYPAEYPRLKEWPDLEGRFWFVYDAGILHQEPYTYLYFATDFPTYTRSLRISHHKPKFREVVKVQRGVLKSCGFELSGFRHPYYHEMDSSYYGEWPIVTTIMPIEALIHMADDGDVGQLVDLRGDEWPPGSTLDTVYGYSSGPPFLFDNIYVPSGCRDGRVWIRGLKPLTGGWWEERNAGWTLQRVHMRSGMWPWVPDPEYTDVRWVQPNPLEHFFPRLPA